MTAGVDPRLLERAHARVVGDGAEPDDAVRRLVRESWQRSLGYRLDADRIVAEPELTDDQLRAYRNAHPLQATLPVLQRLLIRHTFDAGLIVAVGDSAGRLLWIDGDRDLSRRAEGMGFLEGANWSERADPFANVQRGSGRGPGWQRAQQSGQFVKEPVRIVEARASAVSLGNKGRDDMSIGLRVFHQKFGYGTVAEIEGNKLEIDFETAGRKRVMDSFVQPA